MALLRREQSSDIYDHAPIIRALSKMDASAEERIVWKFDIAYTLVKEDMALAKMKVLCQLEERHGVQLGKGTTIIFCALLL